MPAISIAEAVPAASRSLKLDGVSPYAFAIHRGSPPGYPIDYILLGGSSQRLTANGVKVPNGTFISVSGNPVALYEPTYLAFFGESTMSLATHKGNLTPHLTPVTPGGHVLRFSVTSGTGVFANSQGTETVTFGLFDKSYDRRHVPFRRLKGWSLHQVPWVGPGLRWVTKSACSTEPIPCRTTASKRAESPPIIAAGSSHSPGKTSLRRMPSAPGASSS